jgi:CubicO group peptidase (beta-lactamase class C family)
MQHDSILRFYSMTKAITSVSIMMLVEENKIELDDPVSKYLPQLDGLQVFSEKVDGEFKLVDAKRKMTIRDLLRHTSGLTYGFFGDTPIDQAYKRSGILSKSDTLQITTEKLSNLPLLYQPGSRFNYSVSTDVLGHIVQQVSGQRLDKFFEQRVLVPLGMRDTAFHVAAEKADRFANNYGPKQSDGGLNVIDAASSSRYLKPPKLYSGGGGLVSTARDYMRLCQMLLNKGELNGTRLLKSTTVESMTKNQLPDEAYPVTLFGTRDGVGFGLGFSVVVEKTDWTKFCHLDEYGWGGAASTHYWISPRDDLAVVVLTQYMPFSFQLETAVKPLVYDAIIKWTNLRKRVRDLFGT